MRSSADRTPADALHRRWRWLAHQATSSDPDAKHLAAEDLEDAAETERRARRDYRGRYPIELLQNAHDACSDCGRVGAAHFVITDSALLVANEGVPFTYERVKSLLRMGNSEKAGRRLKHHLIGYKGIGFSSVFQISDRPQVISQTISFGFDPELARAKVREAFGRAPRKLPVRPFAVEIEPAQWADDRREVDALFGHGAVISDENAGVARAFRI